MSRILLLVLMNVLIASATAPLKAFDKSLRSLVVGQAAQPQGSKQKRYIITGGPSVGKTSIINYLAEQGYAVVKEAAEDVIKYALSKGVKAPWLEAGFQGDVSELFDKRAKEAAGKKAPLIFFDRGPVDSASYMQLFNPTKQSRVINSVQSALDEPFYETTVFLIDDLGFCKKDEVRNESHKTAMKISQRIEHDYKELGFNVVHVPVATVKERSEFILKKVGREPSLGKPIASCIKRLAKKPVGNKQKRYILTGGPGVGKTSIINCLSKRGYYTVKEAATTIIQKGLSRGEKAPWADPCFETKVSRLYDTREAWAAVRDVPVVFFDRGKIDQVSYMLLLNQSDQKTVIKSTQKVIDEPFYELTVFIIDDLGFCKNDEVRQESYNESIRIGKRIEQDYKDLGFNVVHIPADTVDKRVDMILKHIGS